MPTQTRSADGAASLDPNVLLQQMQAAVAQNAIEEATLIGERLLAAGYEHPLALHLTAYRLQVQGRLDQALARLEHARRLAPQDVFILCAIAACMSQQGREDQALQLYEEALGMQPEHAPAHHGRGVALSALGRQEESRYAHLRALDLAPRYPDTLGALANHAVRDGDLDAAAKYAGRALALDPDEPASTLTKAFVQHKRGGDLVALAGLDARLARGALAPLHVSAFQGLRADILERLDRSSAALNAAAAANAALAAVHAPLMAQAGVEGGVTLCRRLLQTFQEPLGAWTAAPTRRRKPPAKAPTAHVFVVGFVRSGTTLLEQVLASHPDAVTLEEKPILRGLSHAFFRNRVGLERLERLEAVEADKLRLSYWRQVSENGVDAAGKVFVDKNPLDAIWLPAVAKLFPEARVLIVRRDPRDVVVSAFRHRFIYNALTSPLTRLDTAAEFYDVLMTLTERYRTELPLAFHAYRHEDLVRSFDAEVKAICAFIGLPWTDTLRDFAATAQRRTINTPSADQVRQGLNDTGIGRWRRYGEALDSILPRLKHWVDAFGYAP